MFLMSEVQCTPVQTPSGMHTAPLTNRTTVTQMTYFSSPGPKCEDCHHVLYHDLFWYKTLLGWSTVAEEARATTFVSKVYQLVHSPN